MATYPGQFQQQFFDSSGNPLSLGKIYTYSAGTTTPALTYTDAAQGTENQNPVVLDSAGRASIWLPANTAYKFQIKTSADVLIQTIDVIYGTPALAGAVTIGDLTVTGNTVIGNASGDTLTIAPSAVTWTNNPTHSGNHTFSGNMSFGNGTSDTITIGGGEVIQTTAATGLTIRANTSDGADNSFVQINGGGAFNSSGTRGGYITVYGNEAAGFLGTVRVIAGNSASAHVYIAHTLSGPAIDVDATGVAIGSGVLATNATVGFIKIPTCAGTPTGVPTIGDGALVVNTTNNKLYFYSGSWRDAGP